MFSPLTTTHGNRCQNAGWKGHKTSCRDLKSCRGEGQEAQISLDDIRKRVADAAASRDREGVLRWESKIAELVEGKDHQTVLGVLMSFADAYQGAHKFARAGEMFGRFSDVCEVAKRFSEQMEAIHAAARNFMADGDTRTGILWFERGRDASAQHGFALMEGRMCLGLGTAFAVAEDAEAQFRRGLAVVESAGANDASHAHHQGQGRGTRDERAHLEKAARRLLVETLAFKGDIEAADTLFLRLREGGNTSPDYRFFDNFLKGSLLAGRCDYDAAVKAFQAAVKP